MRYLALFLAFLSGAASAQDSTFEREFSKFDKDFERLNHWKADTPASKKLKRAPTATATTPAAETGVTPLDDGASARQVADPAASALEKPTTDQAVPAKPLNSTSSPKGLPKGAKVEKLSRNDLIGHQISDPEVRKKVQDLYKRPDVVVQQYVLPTN